jgi:hypothetical protein
VHILFGILALPLALLALLGGALQPAPPAGGAPATDPALRGSIDAQGDSLRTNLTLGRGSLALDATLGEAGPQGQFSVEVPEVAAFSASRQDSRLAAALAVCVGNQEVSVNAGRGAGLQVLFATADGRPDACTLATAPRPQALTLVMAPFALQAAPASATAADGLLGGIYEVLRRVLVLGLLTGLLWLVAPGYPNAIAGAARTKPWTRLALGFSLLIIMPVVSIATFVAGLSIGLWWLGLLLAAFYLCLLGLGSAVGGCVLGTWLAGRLPARSRPLPTVLVFGLGLVALSILGLLPLVGIFVNLAAWIYGIGTLVLAPRALPARLPASAPIPVPIPVPVAEDPAPV